MTTTYDLFHPRGDLLPGLLVDYQGTVIMPDGERVVLHGATPDGHCYVRGSDPQAHPRAYQHASVRVDLMHPGARAHVARFLAVGERCPECEGGVIRVGLFPGDPEDCPDCDGTGRVRPPHVGAWNLLDMPGRNNLTARESAALLGCLLLRVAAGMEPVRGVLGRWSWRGFGRRGKGGGMVPQCGWACHEPEIGQYADGPEVSKAGVAEADAAALDRGYALRDGGSLVLPCHDGSVTMSRRRLPEELPADWSGLPSPYRDGEE